jgi:UDP-N-acetylmuramoyl-L-alanyl-D-glutamate--2,6-diaminopimelate ligase
MQFIGDPDDTLGIVDYAHTPDSLEKLLQAASQHRRGKMICVFGCGGFRDRGKRRIMGEIAGRYSDFCIITSDNPRGEPPENIALAIEEGMHPTGCGYSIILDRYQAIKRAVALADKWDTIVVAGKGHETYQISGDVCVPFNDKEVLKELLEKKYEKTYDERD